jgi:SAM-dependent methyltransferase
MSESSEPQAGLTDPSLLSSHAYADSRRFSARQALYEWQRPYHDLPAHVLAAVADSAGLVVDVGCGNGTYVRRLRAARPDLTVLGVDLSAGMLKSISAPVVVADASRLPLPDASADVALALHMLYHLPDVAAGVSELKRILRPGGTLIVATNSRSDKIELQTLWQKAHRDAGAPVPEHGTSFSVHFTLEDATELLPGFFSRVALVRLDSTITVPSPDPVLAYFSSYLPPPAQQGTTTRRVSSALTKRIGEVVRREGAFRVTCRGGLFVCS